MTFSSALHKSIFNKSSQLPVINFPSINFCMIQKILLTNTGIETLTKLSKMCTYRLETYMCVCLYVEKIHNNYIKNI